MVMGDLHCTTSGFSSTWEYGRHMLIDDHIVVYSLRLENGDDNGMARRPYQYAMVVDGRAATAAAAAAAAATTTAATPTTRNDKKRTDRRTRSLRGRRETTVNHR